MHSVIILAAGNGSRLKTSTPKVLHKIGGLAILDHVIRTSKMINPQNTVVVLKPSFAIEQLKYGTEISVAYQQIPQGTGHAVKCGMKMLNSDNNNAEIKEKEKSNNNDDWTFILYADVPLVSADTLRKMLEIAATNIRTGVVVLAMNSSGTQNLGKLAAAEEEGTIKAIVEAKDIKNYEKNNNFDNDSDNSSALLPLCNCGLLVRKSLLDLLIDTIKPSPVTGEIYITEIVRLVYEKGYNCRYYQADSMELSGANTLAEMAALEHNFQEMARRRFMNNGVTLIAPETVFFSYDTEIEPDAIIRQYVVFSEGAHVKSGASVGPFCVIEGANIGNAQVGPFSRIRPNSEINDGAKIGNFVEIKNSVISEKTKVNHLTYIGDSFIGKNTNIGAGTITCNYDGVQKHKTKIGENVFVGSNSAIVAPVKIDDNATIGAGSVITSDVPKGNLAVARERQKNIADWISKKSKKEKGAN